MRANERLPLRLHVAKTVSAVAGAASVAASGAASAITTIADAITVAVAMDAAVIHRLPRRGRGRRHWRRVRRSLDGAASLRRPPPPSRRACPRFQR